MRDTTKGNTAHASNFNPTSSPCLHLQQTPLQTCLHDSKNRLIALPLPSLHRTFIQTSPTFITMSDSTPATPKAATGIAALSIRETEILGMAWSCLKTGPPDVSSPFLMNAGTLKSMPSCLILLFFLPCRRVAVYPGVASVVLPSCPNKPCQPHALNPLLLIQQPFLIMITHLSSIYRLIITSLPGCWAWSTLAALPTLGAVSRRRVRRALFLRKPFPPFQRITHSSNHTVQAQN